ncbi:MAG TPA: hypothetical protein VFL54_02160 [Gammaproteobacteria bacterium]|nr:hypothetical protein [Gammaproteobacteria bacterium]
MYPTGKRACLYAVSFAALLLGACGREPQVAPAASKGCDAPEVRTVVERFGLALKRVSLLAPMAMLKRDIRRAYAPFVTPQLLQTWLADPTAAPGRRVSSPWPARIDVNTVQPAANGACTVTGEIVYVTSVERAHGGAAARRAVKLQVINANGWRIDAYAAH